jgi:lipid-binding SYLF domain-containing protein
MNVANAIPGWLPSGQTRAVRVWRLAKTDVAIRHTKGGLIVFKWMIPMVALVAGLAVLSGCATAPATKEDRAELSRDVNAALAKAKAQDSSLQALLNKAHGYAVFPAVGKGAAGVGGAYGKGELFERGKKIGYVDLTQATIGLALGGQTFTEILVFENKAALDNFKSGNFKFTAQATGTALKSGAAANAKFTDGVTVLTANPEGLMGEAAIGGQTFSFQPL